MYVRRKVYFCTKFVKWYFYKYISNIQKKLYNVICRQNQTVTRGQRTTSTQGSPALDIDAGLFSKIERGERPAKREQVIALTSILHTNEKKLLICP